MHAIKTIFVVSMTVVQFLASVDSCSCVMKHPQQYYCDSDFVIFGKVLRMKKFYTKGNSQYHENKSVLMSRRYRIRVFRVYKQPSNGARIGRSIHVKIAASNEACGLHLGLKRKYIIGGTTILHELWLEPCDWVKDFKTLVPTQIMGLKNTYKKHCKCKITGCMGYKCGRSGKYGRRHCNMETGHWSCYAKYGKCLYRRRGKNDFCHWNKSDKMAKCLQSGQNWNSQSSQFQ